MSEQKRLIMIVHQFGMKHFISKYPQEQQQDIYIQLMDDDIGLDDTIGTAVISEMDLPMYSGEEKRLQIPVKRKNQVSGIIFFRIKKVGGPDLMKSSKPSFYYTQSQYEPYVQPMPPQQQQYMPSHIPIYSPLQETQPRQMQVPTYSNYPSSQAYYQNQAQPPFQPQPQSQPQPQFKNQLQFQPQPYNPQVFNNANPYPPLSSNQPMSQYYPQSSTQPLAYNQYQQYTNQQYTNQNMQTQPNYNFQAQRY